MAAPLLTTQGTLSCPHGGTVIATAPGPRVMVAGQPVPTLGNPALVTGCPFGCVTATWLAGSARVLAAGRPVLLATSPGLCLTAEQIPQGPVLAVAPQPRVLGT